MIVTQGKEILGGYWWFNRHEYSGTDTDIPDPSRVSYSWIAPGKTDQCTPVPVSDLPRYLTDDVINSLKATWPEDFSMSLRPCREGNRVINPLEVILDALMGDP